ncbi:MAG: hypothetical protein A3G33_03515 [Omnitrophica bacterium RIFCSPLOWO2_12_FULL_44_17]|uniref:Type II secretion system protein GspI C-terminal domain-containing protein n=1 Tax=Candidatus Danuiimicrobium aquiferis TaxID=1801832 RepID=A0A1G1KTV3_9BACT|nr:MAG: hypothetical protein A3B72_07060 [Omnitrophica bacterium RIFCSPHIGHO2_02_FULL_45_28]OGW88730.1 MAG: hypothetical protein A3E74_05255 [Omnitrophica bacterium RIFCSPHIGHO2_12_FULL_44_12]OGW96383.1 MAG: hypothetical protein A3G33_03515 [Omnitrophica bacterium RIFCSPLOWO2_12_FULL_44_17]OGX04811.1 MAG: hypothetical protein A3J12_07615 [Omnitrophica bacterium RIFCSPLOWO2_02_FULL_44_11]
MIFKEESGFFMKAFRTAESGFTYIEMLVVISLMALCFVPLLQMFTQSVSEVSQYTEVGIATQLGRNAMEHIKNYRGSKSQLMRMGEAWEPPVDKPPIELNDMKWRILRRPVSGTDPLEMHIEVFRAENLKKPLIDFVTLLEDL